MRKYLSDSLIAVQQVAKERRKEEGNVLLNDVLDTFYFVVVQIMRKETCCCLYRGLFLPLSNKKSFICTIPQTGLYKPLLYAPSHKQDCTNLCYTSYGQMAGMRNSSVIPPSEIDLTTHCTVSRCSAIERNPTPISSGCITGPETEKYCSLS